MLALKEETLSKSSSYIKVNNKWYIIGKIGEGGASKVYIGRDETNSNKVAVKIGRENSQIAALLFKKEAKRHCSLKHKHIIEFKEFHELVALECTQDNKHYSAAMVLELAPKGDLLALLEEVKVFSEVIARTYFRQIISGLEYIHERGLVHRDIKPDNLMLDANYRLKIADFGCAGRIKKLGLLKRLVGTLNYFSPEIHSNRPYCGRKADLFAAAIVLFSMVLGHMPFGKAVDHDPYYKYLGQKNTQKFWKAHQDATLEICANEKPVIWFKEPSSDYKHLIEKMMDPDPNKRPSISELKTDKWFNGNILNDLELAKAMDKLLKAKKIGRKK